MAGPIVFSARPDAADASGWQLFVMEADGSSVRRLTRTDGDTNPVWSPDGSQVAFERCCGSRPGVWLIDADGTNERFLTEGSGPAWSPDGEEVAVTRSPGEKGEHITLVDPGENRGHTLIEHAAWPQWSPDGEYIAFERGTDYAESVYVMRSDGSDVRRLTSGPGDGCIAWSPSSDEIAYCRGPNDDVYVVDVETGQSRHVGRTPDIEGADWPPEPDWSPDGSRIVFSALGGLDGDAELIHVVEPSGMNQRVLSPTNVEYVTDASPSWSPDGRTIIFTNSDEVLEPNLWVMNADGSGRRRLSTGPFSEADQGVDWAAVR